MILTEGQELALKAVDLVKKSHPDGGGIVVINGPAGSGKALAFDQLIFTANGPKPIGEAKVGDEIFGPSGRLVKITGVFPQGVRQSYRVSFRDGSSVECDLNHLWTVWTSKTRNTTGNTFTLSLGEIISRGLRFSAGDCKFCIPLCAPIEYERKDLPIDPYLLGLLIGDGTNLGKYPTLCTPDVDNELVHSASKLLFPGMQVTFCRAPACPQYRFTDPQWRGKGNRLGHAFKELGLGVKSPQRFIPEIYLRGSKEQRLALLRGLMDTDGSCSENRTSFSTMSSRLVTGIVELVQSLGGTAIAKQESRGEWHVNVKTFDCPFLLKRKARNWRPTTKNPPSRYITNVEPSRLCDHVCIKVDSSDGLFLTNSYIVTHNTQVLRAITESEDITVLTPTGKAASRVKEVAPTANAMTIHRWLYEIVEDPDTGKLLTTLKSEVTLPENRCIFIDEASMVTFKMARDLYTVCKTHGLNLVFMGDSFQLPPVEMNEELRNFSVLSSDFPAHYRVDMTEIVRQALDSPIIRVSMEVRDMRSSLAGLSSLPCFSVDKLPEEGAKTFDNGGFVICHKNVTRHTLNNSVRKQLGYGEKLKRGEPLMVLFNNYDVDLFNGEIVSVLTEPQLLGTKPVPVRDRYINETMNMWYYETAVDSPQGRVKVLYSDAEVFGTSGKINTKAIRKAGQDYSRSLMIADRKQEESPISYQELKDIKGLPVLNANLGYVSTAHKSQGQEAPEVIVFIEDSIRMHTQDGRRWLYSALTRAKQSLKICWG